MIETAFVLCPGHSAQCAVPFKDVALRVSNCTSPMAVTYLERLCYEVFIGFRELCGLLHDALDSGRAKIELGRHLG